MRTDNIGLGCWLHASGRAKFLRVEPSAPRSRKAMLIFDGPDQDELGALELAFSSGAPGNVFAALAFERNVKRMIHLLFNRDN